MLRPDERAARAGARRCLLNNGMYSQTYRRIDAVALARALQGYTLPAKIALGPGRTFFRDRDHQLMSTILVGEVHPPEGDPFDVFSARAIVKADQAAEPAEASACRVAFPS